MGEPFLFPSECVPCIAEQFGLASGHVLWEVFSLEQPCCQECAQPPDRVLEPVHAFVRKIILINALWPGRPFQEVLEQVPHRVHKAYVRVPRRNTEARVHSEHLHLDRQTLHEQKVATDSHRILIGRDRVDPAARQEQCLTCANKSISNVQKTKIPARRVIATRSSAGTTSANETGGRAIDPSKASKRRRFRSVGRTA